MTYHNVRKKWKVCVEMDLRRGGTMGIKMMIGTVIMGGR
jgi:hypothetical protein